MSSNSRHRHRAYSFVRQCTKGRYSIFKAQRVYKLRFGDILNWRGCSHPRVQGGAGAGGGLAARAGRAEPRAEVAETVRAARLLQDPGRQEEELYADALAECAAALALRREPATLCDRADALLGLDMFDDGTRTAAPMHWDMKSALGQLGGPPARTFLTLNERCLRTFRSRPRFLKDGLLMVSCRRGIST
ncbi:jg24999 [Pararge aegeria aegeria]|uniref:Jg24999 protein n=1 Tax=Pararge aegeria aegeria TaxID=348720 RepID=A0A8S4QIK3_9NEOP|nr:jg24999 [Pararge aegeria aegeria]